MSEDLTKTLAGDDLIRFLIAQLRTEMAQTRDQMTLRMDAFDQKLGALDQKVDRRLADTRPIWESVQSSLADIKATLRSIDRQMAQLALDVLRVRGDQRELEGRVDKLAPS